MDCSRIQEYLDENFLAGGYHLSVAIEEHIGKCPECKAAYEEMLALSRTLDPLVNIAMTADEAARFESKMARAMAEIDYVKPSYAPENRFFSIARLALAAAAVLIIMAVTRDPDFSTGLAILQNADTWQSSRLETEDMALLFANGDSDLLPSPMDDQAVDYLTDQIQPAQAESILESVTAEELEWLQENLTLEI